MAEQYHLAQVNIGRILGPMDGPIMADLEKCKAAVPPLLPADSARTVACVRIGEI